MKSFKDFINEEGNPLIKNSVGNPPEPKDTGNAHNIKEDDLIISIQERLDNCVDVIDSVIHDCEKSSFSPERLKEINAQLNKYMDSIKQEFAKPDKSNI